MSRPRRRRSDRLTPLYVVRVLVIAATLGGGVMSSARVLRQSVPDTAVLQERVNALTRELDSSTATVASIQAAAALTNIAVERRLTSLESSTATMEKLGWIIVALLLGLTVERGLAIKKELGK